MRYLSLFSGVGGFELGLGENECIGYSEIEPKIIEIYQKHFPNHKNYGNITSIDPTTLPDFDLIVGGFPCPDFSIAGKREGFDGRQGNLFFEIVRIARIKKPTYLLLENVRGLLSHDGGRTFKAILQTLHELGYDTEWSLFYSNDFGVPQSRPRVYMFGTLRGEESEQTNVGERYYKKTPILLECKKKFRNKNYDWGEIGRVSAEIIREDAGIPIELDIGDTSNLEKIRNGQRSHSKCSQSIK